MLVKIMFLQLAEEKLDLNEQLGDLPPFQPNLRRGSESSARKMSLGLPPDFFNSGWLLRLWPKKFFVKNQRAARETKQSKEFN